MDLCILPREIIDLIAEKEYENYYESSLVKYHKELFWDPYGIFRIKSYHLPNNINFANFRNLHTIEIVYANLYDYFQYFQNVKKIKCPSTKCDEIVIKHLKSIEYLNVDSYYIIDICLYYIPNILVLKLPGNTKITDKGLKYLVKIQNMNLNCNPNITDLGLYYIRNTIKILLISSAGKITNKGLSYLNTYKIRINTRYTPYKRFYTNWTNLRHLYIATYENSEYVITDDLLMYIREIITLEIKDINNIITDAGLSYISNVRTLACKGIDISDHGLSLIPQVRHLCLYRNTQVTNKGIKCLKYLNSVYMYDNCNISFSLLENTNHQVKWYKHDFKIMTACILLGIFTILGIWIKVKFYTFL